MRIIRTFMLLAVIGILLLLVGCWIPENFEAHIEVNKDGSNTFTYDGTLAYAPLLGGENQLSREDEAQMNKMVDDFLKLPGFKKVSYIGNARHKVFVEKFSKREETYYFVKRDAIIFSIQPKPDGTALIKATRPNKEQVEELKQVGAKMAGNLKVTVAKGVKVIKHNAQSRPKAFGMFEAYKWEIKSPEADPFIIVKPSS